MGTVLVAGVQPRSMSEEPVRSRGFFAVHLPVARVIRFERNRAHVHRESHTDAARTRPPIAVAQDVVVDVAWIDAEGEHCETPYAALVSPFHQPRILTARQR